MQVTVRINKNTGKPELFFYNRNQRTYWLECYDGGNQDCPIEYMRYCTRPANGETEAQACAQLFAQWCGLPGGDPLDPPRLVSRLAVGGAR